MLVEKPNYESCNYNSDPIGDVLEGLLRAKRLGSSVGGGVEVLELASGSGQHAVYMTRRFPPSFIARWVCTDLPEMLPGICRWLQEDGKQHAALVQQPHALSFTDTESRWIEIRQLACTSTSNTVNGTAREIGYDLVFTSNSLHIAPWEACCVLFRRLPLVVRPGGMFIVYGAFNYNGTFTTESNRRFDARLKQSHPWCGIREKEAVESLLAQQGFTLEEDYAMPDNNRCLCFRRREVAVQVEKREMPRAARRRGGGGGGGEGSEAGILPQRVRPVPLRLFSTQLQMLPLLPQYAVRYERRQRRQRRAAKEGIVTVERRCIIPLRFCDVSVGNQLPSRAGARRSAEMRFNTVLWGMKDVCRLKFAELTPANSCFTFL